MIIVGDNTSTVGSLTVSGRTMLEDAFPMIGHYPTTDLGSPVSDSLAKFYANDLILCRIEKVIFNDPATIVIWKDKTKTVVKCHNEPFDREKGLAMCIAKKVLWKDFHKTFREWCERSDV